MKKEDILISRAANLSVADLFEIQAKNNPKVLAVQDVDGKKYQYRQTLNRVLKISKIFINKGVKPKDRIAIISENRKEYLEIEMACAKIGAILVAINWRLSDNEINYCINLVKPKLVILSLKFKNHKKLDSIKNKKLISLSTSFERQITSIKPYNGRSLGEGEDILVILFTSGTTGYPKGAKISHRAFISRALYFAFEYNIDKYDTFPAWAPMFHMASTDLAIGSLLIGGSVAFIDGFNPRKITSLIKKYKLSWLVLMPGMLEEYIKFIEDKNMDIKGIKAMGAMADLIPKNQIKNITKLLDTPYLNSFGSTETGMPPASKGFIAKNKNNFSLSKIQSSFCEVKLVKNNKEVGYETPGECAVRGPTLFSGYWKSEKTNIKDFKGGWFHMGDMMKRTREETFDFVDRKKYLIKSGGENIYPAEIERVILKHKDINEAVVVKIKSKKWGETPIAIISISNNDRQKIIIEELKKSCRKYLAGYKQPANILVIKEKDIPRSTTGKVQRHLVEKMLKPVFNLEMVN